MPGGLHRCGIQRQRGWGFGRGTAMPRALLAQASLGAGEGEEKAGASRAGPGGRSVCKEQPPWAALSSGGGGAQTWDVLSQGFRPTCDLAWLSWLVTVGLLELVSSHHALGRRAPLV